MKLHSYHTKSNVAQHDIITLTTEITNLTLNDSWKGTVRQFLSHFKEKLRLLDSLVPVSDQLPETTRLTFLQRVVQQNHDLRQIHVMDSVWRFKTESTEALTFDNTTTSFGMQPISMIFIKPRKDLRERHSPLNKKISMMLMNMPMQKSNFPLTQNQWNILLIQYTSHHFIPRCHRSLSSLATSGKHNKKVKLNNPTPYPSGSKTKPNPTLGKSTPTPKQVHQHSQDEPADRQKYWSTILLV